MNRRSLISSVGGVVLAALVVVGVSELGRPSEYWGYLFPWVRAVVPWLIALGAVLGVAVRLSPRFPALVGVAAGLLILTYTLGRPIGPLTTSFLELRGYAPVSVFIIGVLLTATVFAFRGQPSLTDRPFSWRRAGLAAVLGLLLARVSVYLLAPLLQLHWQALSRWHWSTVMWSVLGLTLFGVLFGLLLWKATETRALGVGALAGIAALIVTTPWLWTGGMWLGPTSDGLVAGSPVGLVMVGMLLGAVLSRRRSIESSPEPAQGEPAVAGG